MARYRGAMVTIDRDAFFRQIDDFILDNYKNIEQVKWAKNQIIMAYAYAVVAFAQKRSKGPIDPQGLNRGAAWLIPVRRITSKYYTGWRAEELGPGAWRVTNPSREAYFIEFGINHESTGLYGPQGQRVRVRRPVLKLSAMEAMAWGQGTQFDIKLISHFWKNTSTGAPGLVGGNIYGIGVSPGVPIGLF